MANPTLKVEIAFASDPLSTTPTWVDVSSYVRQSDGVQIRRGNLANDPQGHDSAGSFEFTLANLDRRFDWTHATGPYFGQLTPRKQVRISGTSGSDYPLIYGWTTGFKCESRNMGKDAVTIVRGFDALGMLAGKRLNGDPLADYVDSIATPTVWFRNADSNSWNDYQGVYSGVAGAPLDVKVFSPATAITPASATTVTADGIGWVRIQPALAVTTAWSVSFWINTTETGTGYLNSVAPVLGGVYGSAHWYVGINTSGQVRFGNGTSTAIDSATAVNDGITHHVVVTRSGTTISIYVDQVLSTTATAASTPDIDFRFIMAHSSPASPDVAGVGQIMTAVCAIQDILIIPAALTQAQILFVANLTFGKALETTAARCTRLLDEADWPAAWRDISTATRGECGPIAYNGQSILTGLQQVERTEQGRLYAALSGKVTFRQRYYAYEDTVSKTSQLTLSDDGANQPYRTFGHRRGDEDVVNDATVTNGSIESRSTNAASRTTYDTNANTYDTVLSTYSQIDQMSDGLIFLYKDARIRLDPIEVQNSAASWPDLLSLELGSRARVESTPMAVGVQMVEEVLVESVQWDISDAGWKFTVSGSPVPPAPATAGFWSLDVSALDTSTALAF